MFLLILKFIIETPILLRHLNSLIYHSCNTYLYYVFLFAVLFLVFLYGFTNTFSHSINARSKSNEQPRLSRRYVTLKYAAESYDGLLGKRATKKKKSKGREDPERGAH